MPKGLHFILRLIGSCWWIWSIRVIRSDSHFYCLCCRERIKGKGGAKMEVGNGSSAGEWRWSPWVSNWLTGGHKARKLQSQSNPSTFWLFSTLAQKSQDSMILQICTVFCECLKIFFIPLSLSSYARLSALSGQDLSHFKFLTAWTQITPCKC